MQFIHVLKFIMKFMICMKLIMNIMRRMNFMKYSAFSYRKLHTET